MGASSLLNNEVSILSRLVSRQRIIDALLKNREQRFLSGSLNNIDDLDAEILVEEYQDLGRKIEEISESMLKS